MLLARVLGRHAKLCVAKPERLRSSSEWQLVIANETGNVQQFECERGLCTSESSDWRALQESGASGPRTSLSAKASSQLGAFFRLALQKPGSMCPIGTCAMVLAKFWVEAVSVSQRQGRRRDPSFGG